MPKAAPQKNPAVLNVNRLTLAFAKAVANNQADKSDNLVVSPYNALTALSMVAKGAANNTREEMAQSLFGSDAKELDNAVTNLAALNTQILDANKDQVTLSTANGVWANKELFELNKPYADELKKIFGAEISAEAFSDKSVPAKINKWAADNTNNLITDIVEKLEKDDFAILASALYFKSQWTNKFNKDQTEDRSFTQDSKNITYTPTMRKFFAEGEIEYHETSDFEAVALTYGQKDHKKSLSPTMRAILIRPRDENLQARDWLAQQAALPYPAWMEAGSFVPVQGTVELPRMDIKQKHDLIPALQELGIRDAFDDRAADFTPMTKEGSKEILIGKVTHDVVFKTDEEGSEAAAVTSVGMFRTTSVHIPAPTIDIKFDRSFVFALQDIKTGAIIFAGAVNKPNNDMKQVKKAPTLK